jgi:hypothetical protein
MNFKIIFGGEKLKILIIGNGFDLAHGLPTKYTDFLDCVIFLNEENDKYGLRDAAERLQLWDEFSKIISNNTWLKYFIQRYKNKQFKGEKWIDFEEEMSEVIEDFESWYYTDDDKEITILKDAHDEDNLFFNIIYRDFIICYPDCYDELEKGHWGAKLHPPYSFDFIDFLGHKLKTFTRAFEIYCVCLINHANICNRTQRIMKQHDYDCVLSFNYTNTYAALYGNPKTKYCYIHGSAQESSEKTNMVLGVDDKLEYKEADNNFAFVPFKKYWQRININSASEYYDWIKTIGAIRVDTEISLVGHSLGLTDHEALHKFFGLANRQDVVIKMYYRNKKAKEVLKQRTIGIVGKNIFIERFNNRAIQFIDQYSKDDGIFETPSEEKDERIAKE